MFRKFGPKLLSLALLSLCLSAGFAAVSKAQAVSTNISGRERTLAAESFATEKLWLWQKRLNLEDWRIAIEITRAGELKSKTLGNIHWDSERKTAVIRVLHPADYHLPLREMLDDIEF